MSLVPRRGRNAGIAFAEAVLARLGFRPNQAARSLRRQRANAIGFQVETANRRSFGNLLDPFLAALTASAQSDDAHLITFVAAEEQVIVTPTALWP